MRPHNPHIKFVDVNNGSKFSAVIFMDLAAEKKERLLQQENKLYSNLFDNIIDRKLKMHACLFSIFTIIRKFIKQKIK